MQSTNPTYRISVASKFDGFWRYNLIITGGEFAADGSRTGFFSGEDKIADVGSNLTVAPCTPSRRRVLEVTAADCERLLMYIYVLPHTMPVEDTVDEVHPFSITVRVDYDGRLLRKEEFSVNQWSGANIEFAVSRNEPNNK